MWLRLWMGCLALVAMGCEFKGGHAPGAAEATPNPQADAPAEVWIARPVSMRIYPATRFVHREGEPVLETRVELLDDMDDPIKGAGEFSIELLEAPNPRRSGVGRQLYVWDGEELELLTLQDQKDLYDPISRGYLFRLKLDNFEVAERRTMIRVRYTPVNGPRLTDEMPVRTDW